MFASSAYAVTFACLEFNIMSSRRSDTSCGTWSCAVCGKSCVNLGLKLVQVRAWNKCALFHKQEPHSRLYSTNTQSWQQSFLLCVDYVAISVMRLTYSPE